MERRSFREETARFVVDGMLLVDEALSSGLVETVFIDVDALETDDRLTALAEGARLAGADVQAVAPGVLARVADPVTPQPVVAVARRPAAASWQGVGSTTGVLICDGIADPGNLGTLLRVAEAAGLDALWVVGGGTDPFGPKAVRASAGSVLRVPVAVAADPAALVAELVARGFSVAGLRSDGTPYDTAVLAPPVALVVGSEAHGISPGVGDQVTEWIGIPMAGAVESLNAGVAGAVVAMELARRRRTGSGADGGAR